jgi:hypothetical protein
VDPDEQDQARHPVTDDSLTGAGAFDTEGGEAPARDDASTARGSNRRGSSKPRERVYRSPIDYREVLAGAGVKVPVEEAVIRYYRDAARPHLVPFPKRVHTRAAEPQPEGLDVWDAGSPFDEIDWLQTTITSPIVVPGVTTMTRTYGTVEGDSPERRPLDLFLGVDCSGSMVNPAHQTSFPVIGGTIMVLSALRAGARAMVTLSGEPGGFVSTPGFIDDEHECLRVLTGFLGSGYTFGIVRLRDAFAGRTAADPPAHIVIVTDHDIFSMLDGALDGTTGWTMAADALQRARGGGTYLLHMRPGQSRGIDRMRQDGWNVHFVTDWSGVVAYARAFSHEHYGATS